MNKLIFIFASVLVLSGCATSPIHTRSYEELKSWDSRLHRGVIEKEIPNKYINEALDKMKAEGIPRDESARNKQGFFIFIEQSLGSRRRVSLSVDKKFDLKDGDIIDFYGGKTNDEALQKKETYKVYGAAFIGSKFYITDGEVIKTDKPPKLLSVVCRANDDGCNVNSRPGTMIGMGRKMRNAADYHGVEAESQQPIYQFDDTTFAEFWSINACFHCDKDASAE